jgi:hypothetical protein
VEAAKRLPELPAGDADLPGGPVELARSPRRFCRRARLCGLDEHLEEHKGAGPRAEGVEQATRHGEVGVHKATG